MLKAIFFDIDDTLFSTTTFARRARRNSIQAMIDMGLKVELESAYRDLVEVIEEFSSNYSGHYDKFVSRQPSEALQGLNRTLLVSAAIVAYHETKFRELQAYEDVLEGMRCLSKTDLKLGIISSGLGIKQGEKLIRLGVWPYIDQGALFITDEVGIGKPNPKLYRRACETVAVEPGEAMHVGDHPTLDIDPANKIGMITVWNRREEKHGTERGKTRPDHTIYSFWDLLELLQSEYEFDFGLKL